MDSEKEKKTEFAKLILAYAVFSGSTLFFSSLFESYFYKLELEIYQIILSAVCLYIPPILMIFLTKEVRLKEGLKRSAIFMSLAALVLYLFVSPLAPVISRALIGISMFYFWMPFNTHFYSYTKNNAAVLGSIYYSLSPFLSLFFPVFAGTIAKDFGFDLVFFISIFAFLPLIPIVMKFKEDIKYKIEIKKKFDEVNGLKSMIFIEGFALNTITPVTLSAMMLIHFKDPLEFGSFLSATTLFAIAASVLTAKISDKFKNRKDFINISGLGFLIGAIVTLISQSKEEFFIGFGIINFFRSILLPLPLAVMIDKGKDLFDSMISREIILNAGRILAVVLGAILIYFYDIRIMLGIQTIATGAYIVIFQIKKRKLNL